MARRQLVTLGLGRGAIDWRLQTRRLEPIHRGVYVVGGSRPNRRAHWIAAVLAYGDDATLSHRSAAALWGLCADSGPADVTSRQGRPGRRGIRLHRSRLPRSHRTRRDQIPVTTVARTLIDLAGVVAFHELEAAWEEADRLSLLRIREVEDAVEGGAPRRKSVRRLISEANFASSTRSPLEDRFLNLCRVHRLPTPATNALVLGYEVDALWTRERMVVELDGFAYHRHRAAFERDRERDLDLLAAGYRVVRLTHRRLEREPDAVARELLALLGR